MNGSAISKIIAKMTGKLGTSGVKKTVSSAAGKLSAALSKHWAGITKSAVSLGSKVLPRLNRVWIGIAVAICGYLGISYASEGEAAAALGNWLISTPLGIVCLAVVISVAIVLLTRTSSKRSRR